jgi:hypothetical protein
MLGNMSMMERLANGTYAQRSVMAQESNRDDSMHRVSRHCEGECRCHARRIKRTSSGRLVTTDEALPRAQAKRSARPAGAMPVSHDAPEARYVLAG